MCATGPSRTPSARVGSESGAGAARCGPTINSPPATSAAPSACRWLTRPDQFQSGDTSDFVAAGEQPALVFAVGARKETGSARYPVDPVAISRGAGVPDESATAQELYVSFRDPMPGPAPDVFRRSGDNLSP